MGTRQEQRGGVAGSVTTGQMSSDTVRTRSNRMTPGQYVMVNTMAGAEREFWTHGLWKLLVQVMEKKKLATHQGQHQGLQGSAGKTSHQERKTSAQGRRRLSPETSTSRQFSHKKIAPKSGH